MSDQIDKEIQQLITQAQHLLHQVEVRTEILGLKGARNEQLETALDSTQRLLVEAQISFLDGKLGDELFEAFFVGKQSKECLVKWNHTDRVLRIFIPDAWERINTRPSIYIKDILKHRNASNVKVFYTRLIQAILEREKRKGNLEGFEKFSRCYAGFFFHFQDAYVRDPDNFMVKVLIDAAKMAGIFKTDDYDHLMYTAGGLRDPNQSGLSLIFSETLNIFDVIGEGFLNHKSLGNYTTTVDEMVEQLCDNHENESVASLF